MVVWDGGTSAIATRRTFKRVGYFCVATCENSRVNIAAAHNEGEGEGFECEGLLVDIEMSKLF